MTLKPKKLKQTRLAKAKTVLVEGKQARRRNDASKRSGGQTSSAQNLNWADHLNYGLPANFDFSVVKTVDDARTLICTLPNSDRGEAAKGLYEHRENIGQRAAYSGLIDTWDHDHQELILAFGSEEQLAA